MIYLYGWATNTCDTAPSSLVHNASLPAVFPPFVTNQATIEPCRLSVYVAAGLTRMLKVSVSRLESRQMDRVLDTFYLDKNETLRKEAWVYCHGAF